MFRALLAHLQEALHKEQLVYYVCVTSVGCYQDLSGTKVHLVGFAILIYYDARSTKHSDCTVGCIGKQISLQIGSIFKSGSQ
jgi:hypothetical protein